jgi:hypothetical protein
MQYCSPIKKNEIVSLARKWIDFEIIMLSNIIQTSITCFLSYTESRFFFKDMKVEGGLFGKKGASGREDETG